jgi:copper chaperone CopZ
MSDAIASDADGAWTVRRRIRVPGLRNHAEGVAVQRCLAGIDGVLRVSVDAPTGRAVVDYVLTKTDYRSLQRELEAAGYAPTPGRWARIKSAWFQNLDLTGRANAEAPKAACCNQPPGGRSGTLHKR